jgi:DNA-directed RNA polymerase subunit RPC12/RpoP
MVKLVPAVCPQCGADLEVPEHLDKAHCVYCGTKIFIEKKVDKHVHYHVSQALFTCENCGVEKPFKESSGVDGRSLCMDCYYRAKNSASMFRWIGILMVFIGFIPMVSGNSSLGAVGFACILLGIGITMLGRLMAP